MQSVYCYCTGAAKEWM